ncbi:ABC transporter ATP-binding protein [Lachnospiraceae bacterium MD1]|uniref:ABC transporter ATP-binding protein n=1 Tax=Variimorphobacter saccharofermentans TaxID=2755051 RepID=A0A839JXU0_9FIRM|nr:ABC transporter ATP-binding protein [Variimorphobacter saccharofermentans]MBB2181439.1 ABC transporter ATP-binding protein [Variimorphobacter saccharofermentans]
MNYLVEIAKKNKFLVCIYLLSGILIAFLSNFSANYFQRLIDKFNDGSLAVSNIIIYGFVLAIVCVLDYLDEYPGRSLEHGIYIDLKLKALNKISRIDYQVYQSMGTGKLVQKIENGASAGKGVLFDFLFCLFRQLCPSILFSMIFIYSINKKVMLIILIGYIAVFFITNLLLKVLYQIKERILSNEEMMNHILVRGFMEMVVFRINKRFKHEIEKAELAKKEIVNSKVKMTLIHEAFFAIFALLVIVIKIFIIAYGWVTKSLSIGAIIALITLIDNAYTPIAIFNVLFVQYKLDRTAFKRYTDFLDSENDEQLDKGEKITSLKADISCTGLKFLYDNRVVLDNFDLNIRHGENVALVGESGSGKSTLIKLLSGLLKPQGGKISIGTYELNNIDLNSYYDCITYITQESPIFDGTLRENLVFDKNVEDYEIIKALEQVELLDLYNKLENGLDTELGERGTALSGGERQRLALARLWFSQANIIILDEATSAMDNITEEIVMNRVMDLLRTQTVIVIAHRLNSIRKFEHIVVLREGRIVGQDSFNKLLENNAYFKDLYYASTRD